MRHALEHHNGKRIIVFARLRLYTRRQRRALLENLLSADGSFISDHAWINRPKSLLKARVNPGDIFECTAKVIRYERHTGGNNYTLSRLRDINTLYHADDNKENAA